MKNILVDEVKQKALEYYKKANIILTEKEKANIEVADFGLNDIYNTGLQLVVYVNTERCCAKEMILLPYQTCPEHRHAPIENTNYIGKEETFRCRYGTVYLYIEGKAAAEPKAKAPKGSEKWYTVWHEIKLEPGEQYTLYPNTKHWFQSGADGAVISEFSTKSVDEMDIFTDPNIKRIPEIE
jgi:D-lyxose ketol-isomerase